MTVVIIIVSVIVGLIILGSIFRAADEKKLREAAGKGDVKADFDLGVWYLDNNKIPDAKQWLNSALQQGYSEAKSKLRICALKERGFTTSAALERIDEEDTNTRFRDAGRAGDEPETVTGFSNIEKHEVLSKSKNYPMIKEMCMSLAKDGFYVSSKISTDYSKGNWEGLCCLSVWKDPMMDAASYQGVIEFRDLVTMSGKETMVYGYKSQHFENNQKRKTPCYMIQKFPFIIIRSNTPCTEDTPLWLLLCAEVMTTYLPPVTYPDWVNEYPDAKKYVNVMF